MNSGRMENEARPYWTSVRRQNDDVSQWCQIDAILVQAAWNKADAIISHLGPEAIIVVFFNGAIDNRHTDRLLLIVNEEKSEYFKK